MCMCTLHRIMGLKGRRLFLTEKQKSIKEQTNSPKKYVYVCVSVYVSMYVRM